MFKKILQSIKNFTHDLPKWARVLIFLLILIPGLIVAGFVIITSIFKKAPHLPIAPVDVGDSPASGHANKEGTDIIPEEDAENITKLLNEIKTDLLR